MRFLLAVLSLMMLVSCHRRPEYQPVTFDGRKAVVDLRTLREAVPEFRSITMDGKRIDFFVIVNGGVAASYFDACRECYMKKQGYRHERGAMVCRTCNVRFPCERLDTGIGGCYPIKLPGRRDGDSYIIDREALAEGKKYF